MPTTNKNFLSTVHDGLTKSLESQVAALPSGFNKARFVQNCMSMMQDGREDYSKCDSRSVIRTLMKASYLGLDFFNNECYAIVYGNQCSFQTDYKGEIKVCKRFSRNPIKDIYAKIVRDGDDFEEVIENGRQSINFRPKPFSDAPIIGAFAVVVFVDGSMMYDTMSTNEIEHTRRAFSKAQNSKAWKESPGEMYKKTVIRRLCKLIDLDFDSPEQRKAFEDGSAFDVKEPSSKKEYVAQDVYSENVTVEQADEDEVLESEYIEVEEVDE